MKDKELPGRSHRRGAERPPVLCLNVAREGKDPAMRQGWCETGQADGKSGLRRWRHDEQARG